MDIDSIKSKIKAHIVSQLDGFDDFAYHDNLVDMGILTDEFIFNLIKYLEKHFAVTLYTYELYQEKDKKSLTLDSLGKLIQQKKKPSQKHKITASCNL